MRYGDALTFSGDKHLYGLIYGETKILLKLFLKCSLEKKDKISKWSPYI